jgi:integrase
MKIRRRVYKSGKVAYQFDAGERGGKRVQRSFPTKAAAERAMRHEQRMRQRHGEKVAGLSAGELAALVAARDRLAGAGATLPEAVEFFMQHGARLKESVSVSDLAGRFRAAKQGLQRSAVYVSQLGVSLLSFARYAGSTAAHEVTREQIEEWLASGGWAAKTRNNYLGDISAMFEWGKAAGLVLVNPAAGVERFRLPEAEIETLTSEECNSLLRAAAAGELRVMGCLVLGMFAGLRPAEIGRLDWSAVNVDAAVVVVSGAKSKTRRRRVVDLTTNACAWLRLVPPEMRAGKICGVNFDDVWLIFRRELGWDVGRSELKHVRRAVGPATRGRWPKNCLRHTFASMHYAAHENEARLQVQMGHESAAMLHRHYRALKTKAEAAEFWALKPAV